MYRKNINLLQQKQGMNRYLIFKQDSIAQDNLCSTLMICVSNITFFSTSKELPDPNRPVCPGLSTRISDAIQRDVPLIS